jgi:hypothetical protein
MRRVMLLCLLLAGCAVEEDAPECSTFCGELGMDVAYVTNAWSDRYFGSCVCQPRTSCEVPETR